MASTIWSREDLVFYVHQVMNSRSQHTSSIGVCGILLFLKSMARFSLVPDRHLVSSFSLSESNGIQRVVHMSENSCIALVISLRVLNLRRVL